MLDDNYTKKYPDIEELRRLLLVLKNNKDHIPVSILKSKYKKGTMICVIKSGVRPLLTPWTHHFMGLRCTSPMPMKLLRLSLT